MLRSLRPRQLRLLLLALSVLIAGITAVVLLNRGGSAEAASTPLQLEVPTSANGLALQAAVRQTHDVLQRQSPVTAGAVESPGAVAFPADVSYADAVTLVYMAMVSDRVPAGARLVPSLPQGKTVRLVQGEGPVVDLGAPFDYVNISTDYIVRAPSLNFDSNVSIGELAGVPGRDRVDAPWPIGAHVDIPILPACRIVSAASGSSPASCDLTKDSSYIDTRELLGPRLP